jgi:quercetin dioxygenase-like cupin family protein
MTHHRKFEKPAQKRIAVATRMAAVAALLGAAAIAVPGQATPASGFVGTQLSKGQYGDIDLKLKSDSFDLKLDTKGDSDLYVVRNAIAAGGQSGWHTHPGPSLITVTVGEITVYEDPLCTPKVYRAGDGSIDLGGGHVHLIRNETSAPAETVVVQFVPRDAVRRIDAPQPNNCNF